MSKIDFNYEEQMKQVGEYYRKIIEKMKEDILTNRFADNVNQPAHYQGRVECIDAIEAAVEGLEGLEAVCTANVIKYVWRWKKKNGREDLAKAEWYLKKLLSLQESDRELS